MEITTEGPILYLHGEFDVRCTGAVRSAIDDQLRSHDGDVTIDLHDVGSVDCTALKVLAAASRRATRSGHRIVLVGANGQVRRMLHLTHLIRLVELERDEALVGS